jgi:hypothetical protein
MSQIDLLHDPNQDGPPQPPAAANPKLIGWTFQLNNKDTPEENDMLHFSADSQYNELDRFPDDDDDGYSTVPEENRCAATPPLTVSCEVNPSSASTGDAVTWEATDVDGGNGTYNYEWTNDVSGTHKTETATYVEAGNKSGKVTVYSGAQDRSAQCSIDIGGNGGNGGSNFDLTHTGSSMWAISNAQLRSTKTEIKLTKDAGFNNPVTLTASNDVIANSNTMFVHDGDPPQKTVTIQPGEFADSLYLFTDASVPAATYPLIITGESQGGIIASTTAPLRVQSYVEL